MTKYGKIENNKLVYAPTDFNGVSNWVLDEKAVLKAGYLPIEFRDKPNDQKEYTEEFLQVSSKIIQNWIEVTPTNKDISERRQQEYTIKTDPLTLRKLRKQALNEWTEENEEEYILQIKEISKQIDIDYPYNNE